MLIAEALGLEYLDLDGIADNDISLQLLPEHLIREYQVLPIATSNDHIVMIAAVAHRPEILHDIDFRLTKPVLWKIVEQEKLAKRIARLLHLQEQENLTSEDAPIVAYVEKLLAEAVNKTASDIHIESYKEQLRIRLRIDGVLYDVAQLAAQLAPRLIAHLKVLAQLDITERRLPQDGRLQITISTTQHIDCRMSTCPTIHGEKLVLRLLNIAQVPLEIESLGFSASQKALFLKILQQPQGMLLVTGPTGSGKTVTLYSALKILNQSGVNICSAEDPVEIELLGINQIAINNKIELTFAKVLRAFLRQDPDIIMIGEMRDTETADIAIKAAQTGHLVLSTLHTNSAAETITRLMHMGIPAYHLVAAVKLIVAQRLARKLCHYCKALDSHDYGLAFPHYRAVGCNKCQDGYMGRVAIYELLPISATMAELILQTPAALHLEKQACAEGMQTLYENGLEKVWQGITSYSELLRVTFSNL